MPDPCRDYPDRPFSRFQQGAATPLAAEMLRAAACTAGPDREPTVEGRVSPFWRLFGATVLSVAALVVVTLTQQFSSILTEVRQDLNRMHETRGDLARKEELVEASRDVRTAGANIVALRERTTLMEQQLRSADEERKELARQLQQVRERLAEFGRVQIRGVSIQPPRHVE